MHHFPSILESIKDLSGDQIDGLLALARKFKSYSNDWQGLPIPFIKTPIIATSFLENSTRTKHSFAIAIKKIGAQYIDFHADQSSLKKGETLEETLLNLNAQGVDLCIIRTDIGGELHPFKKHPPIKIINGGDGTHQHPTQALLDLFTMLEIGLEPKGKTIAIIGDNIHSRVGHSLIDLLPQLGAKILLCGPPEFLPEKAPHPQVEMTIHRDEALERSDLLYLLRIQRERHPKSPFHDSGHTLESYIQSYGVNGECLQKLGKKIPIFHPGPANIGVEISLDVMKGPYYFGYEQVQNSIYMRMAILQAILQNNDPHVGIQFKDRKIDDLP